MSEPIQEAVLQGLRFIEANLHEEIGVSDVAASASYSQFYYSREFARHTHCTVYDYILRRKLSEAYKELFSKQIKIVDLAFRYGFQSHEVFTRAYRKMFGENPSESKDYKPLLLFEPIDPGYLQFLVGLRIDQKNQAHPDCFFKVTDASRICDIAQAQPLLVLLSDRHTRGSQCAFHGILCDDENDSLGFTLIGLQHSSRIYHTSTSSVFRYYLEHSYTTDTAAPNYILLLSSNTYTDILCPKYKQRKDV